MGRDFLCHKDCKHLCASHYDPSASGVHMGYGYMVEEDCKFLDQFDEDDTVDDFDHPTPDVVYENCPFYETYTAEEIAMMEAEERAYEAQMQELHDYFEAHKDDEIDDPYIADHWKTFSQEKI